MVAGDLKHSPTFLCLLHTLLLGGGGCGGGGGDGGPLPFQEIIRGRQIDNCN